MLQYVGRLDADVLRDVIVKQYTGDENLSKRQWSGVQSHLASMNQERKAGSPVSRLRKSDTKCDDHNLHVVIQELPPCGNSAALLCIGKK